MEWAQLVLEYVKVLAWPIVVGSAVIAFRRQIGRKIGDLKEATTPVGGASFFDREAKQLEEQADRAAERQEAEPAKTEDTEPPADSDEEQVVATSVLRARERRLDKARKFRALTTAFEMLNALPDFAAARNISSSSPAAAVMLAYADLERAARAAWTVSSTEPTPRNMTLTKIVRALTQTGLDPELAHVARELADLRNRIAHGEDLSVSVSGALDFISACESLTEALAANALAKIRHPSRAQLVNEWLNWLQEPRNSSKQPERQEPDDEAPSS